MKSFLNNIQIVDLDVVGNNILNSDFTPKIETPLNQVIVDFDLLYEKTME